uniref:UPF3B regulator of nonsense mediated mRNA decay n=1 Tax=Canis lupus dingo TaxID=286419 RepID=A0A8C0JSK4_CANLU
MKEEKEHRPKEKRVTLLTPPGASGSAGGASGDSTKGDDKQDRNKEKKEALSKVVIRRLPPTLTKEQLQEHLQPMPEHDYFEFFSNDTSLYPHMYARAYINFKNQEDIILFRDRFDGYRDQERILRERERLKRQEEERRRQKERYEKEKAFKRKEEEMKKEKEVVRDKGKKTESTESVGSSEKTEKKEEVVKRDRIRNKDRPAMQLYQPGARSRNRLCPPDDSTKSGDSAIEKKQESGISHRKEGGEE